MNACGNLSLVRNYADMLRISSIFAYCLIKSLRIMYPGRFKAFSLPFDITSHLVLQGTQLYDPKAGGWRDLGMLDVMQVRLQKYLLSYI